MEQPIASNDHDVIAINKIPIVDSLLEVVCRSTGMGFAAIARVTENKWMACCVRDEINFGLVPGGELPLETTICHEIRQHGREVVIDHVADDPEFAQHHTPAMYGFQSYISFPIFRKDGSFFGTLCAIDPRPNKLKTPEIMGTFRLFADLISFHLNAAEELLISETKLGEERETAKLRDQFIAILGHDLRNPLTAVSNSAQLLMYMQADDNVKQIAGIIKSSTERINGLIENILDFARGHLGEGILLDYTNGGMLQQVLKKVVTETLAAHPTQPIELNVHITEPVQCDCDRIEQVVSNLLSNAVSYGKAGAPIMLEAKTIDGRFILSVSNQGAEIPEAAMERLFKPFSRGDVKPGHQGLGLGLYISAEIAKAHRGRLSVHSANELTTFTLNIPVSPN